MSAALIDGKKIAADYRAELAIRVARLRDAGIVPNLAVVVVGDDPASHVYVRNKTFACEAIGMRSQTHKLLLSTRTPE